MCVGELNNFVQFSTDLFNTLYVLLKINLALSQFVSLEL